MGTSIRSGLEMAMGASLGIAFGGSMIGSPVALGLAIGAFAALLLASRLSGDSSD